MFPLLWFTYTYAVLVLCKCARRERTGTQTRHKRWEYPTSNHRQRSHRHLRPRPSAIIHSSARDSLRVSITSKHTHTADTETPHAQRAQPNTQTQPTQNAVECYCDGDILECLRNCMTDHLPFLRVSNDTVRNLNYESNYVVVTIFCKCVVVLLFWIVTFVFEILSGVLIVGSKFSHIIGVPKYIIDHDHMSSLPHPNWCYWFIVFPLEMHFHIKCV